MAVTSLIKYEGDNSTFIWKHPCEDFNSLSQLIVHESQEAVFFMNGQALDLFGPGRHTLETENIPLIGKLMNFVKGAKSPFHCEVYFINKTVQMSVKWGTDSKVRYIDPDTGVPLELGASGTMNLQVKDSRKMLVKLVGTMDGVAWDYSDGGDLNGNLIHRKNPAQSLRDSFRSVISVAVKTSLGAVIRDKNIDVLEIDEHLSEISEILHRKIVPEFEEYGLTVPEFYVTTVVLPEEDPNFRRIRELRSITLQTRMLRAEATVKAAQAQAEADVIAARRQAELERQYTQTEVTKREAERNVIEAQAEALAMKATGLAEAEIMRAKGYTEKDIITADVQKAFAESIGNIGAGGGIVSGSGIASDIMSMAAGFKMAGVMMGQMDSVVDHTLNNANAGTPLLTRCVKCGAELPENAKFCLNCGEKTPVNNTVMCPSCGKTVSRGKFCLECGFRFVSVCSGCGAEIPDGAKFCLECGEKIN